MISLIYISGLLLLLVVSASFSAAETAIVGISHSKVHNMMKEGRWGAASLNRLKKNLRKTLTVILIGNNILNTALSSLATLLAIEAFGSAWIGAAIGVIFFFVLMFGEIFPKTLATVYASHVARYCAPYIETLAFFLSPLIVIVQFVPDKILGSREFGKTIVSEKEIHELMELGIEEQVFEKGEVGLIKNILQFNDIPIKELITPIEQVAKLSIDTTVGDAVKQVSFHNYTRYPIIDKGGYIVGTLRVKRLFQHAYDRRNKKVLELADKPLFIDGEIMIDDAFGMMKKEHKHIIYVTDANGKVIGIATSEDVLGQLVGKF